MTTSNHSPVQDRVRAELVGTYLAQSRVGVFIAFGLVPYLALSFYGHVGLHRIIFWMLSVLLIDGYIVYTSYQFRPDMEPRQVDFFKNRQQLLHMLAGIAWGLAFTMLLDAKNPGNDDYRVAVCIAIVLAFSASTMSASLHGLLSFIIPISILTLAYFIANFDEYAWWAFGLLGLVASCIYFAWMTHRYIVEQLENRYLNIDYTKELETLNKKIEETNFNLMIRNQELLDLQAKLKELATHDELTGLYTRRYIIQRLRSVIPESKRHHLNCCVAMMDVDFFKKVNDTYGHAAGDDVLRTVGLLIANELRQGDIIARFGGEEFLIMLPMTDIQAAQHLVERLRQSIENQKFMFEGQVISVTASFGVTSLAPNDNAERMIERADKALFQAKNAGRNRIETMLQA
ncbi:MAG TPA: GGDEF domain-containing protein [Methylophilus sp.]|nr:GGDEF domain-containing protein [Methylophilus sp.]HQQ33536.1 GGDEF domain-containing protein [Methylophilus sp.]